MYLGHGGWVTSLAVGEEEKVALLVPGQLIHLVFKLFLSFH